MWGLLSKGKGGGSNLIITSLRVTILPVAPLPFFRGNLLKIYLFYALYLQMVLITAAAELIKPHFENIPI